MTFTIRHGTTRDYAATAQYARRVAAAMLADARGAALPADLETARALVCEAKREGAAVDVLRDLEVRAER